MEEEIEVRIPPTPRIRRNNHMWGLGVYVNVDHYRYIAFQIGPWYIYLYNEEPRKAQRSVYCSDDA